MNAEEWKKSQDEIARLNGIIEQIERETKAEMRQSVILALCDAKSKS